MRRRRASESRQGVRGGKGVEGEIWHDLGSKMRKTARKEMVEVEVEVRGERLGVSREGKKGTGET